MSTNKHTRTALSTHAGSMAVALCLCATLGLSACSGAVTSADAQDVPSSAHATSTNTTQTSEQAAKVSYPTEDDITINETLTTAENSAHVIEVDGQQANYSNTAVTKTGDSSLGDEADFYGDNAAIFATNGATLDLTDMVVKTNGTHANAVFSYGKGTTVNVSNSVIETTGDCSGGLMTTGGGATNASNLSIHTTGRSSAAIRSDRGGGTVAVDGGRYVTDGMGSPVIYSTADITVANAQMESTSSQGVVIEGKNSVTLNNVDLIASNTSQNSDKSDWYQAVMIYQSMSGDAAQGASSFTMNGGTLTNKNGDVFFVNNTVTTISLDGASIENQGDDIFLRAAAAGWGNEGSNGGQVTLKATNQIINGDMVVDEVSNLNLYLADGSTFTGAVNADGKAGEVYVELDDNSAWTLTADSYITSLTCGADAINLNGHTLYVNGQAYTAGSESTGQAIEVVVSENAGGEGGPGGPGGPGGTPPDGQGSMPPGGQGSTPPDGAGPGEPGGTPPNGQGGTPPDGTGPGEPGSTPPNGQGSTPPEPPSGT